MICEFFIASAIAIVIIVMAVLLIFDSWTVSTIVRTIALSVFGLSLFFVAMTLSVRGKYINKRKIVIECLDSLIRSNPKEISDTEIIITKKSNIYFRNQNDKSIVHKFDMLDNEASSLELIKGFTIPEELIDKVVKIEDFTSDLIPEFDISFLYKHSLHICGERIY